MGPETDNDGDLDIPYSPDWSITPWAVTPDRTNRLDLTTMTAWPYGRIFGVLVEIEETKSDNKETAFRFEAMYRFNFAADGRIGSNQRCLYALAMAYYPTVILTEPDGFVPGDAITGAATANYGGAGGAQLGGGRKSDLPELIGLPTCTLFGTDYADLGERAAGRSFFLFRRIAIRRTRA